MAKKAKILNLMALVDESLLNFISSFGHQIITEDQWTPETDIEYILIDIEGNIVKVMEKFDTVGKSIDVVLITGQIENIKNFFLVNGRSFIDPEWMQHEMGQVFIEKYFQRENSIHLDEILPPRFENISSNKISNHAKMGHYVDMMAAEAFEKGFNVAPIRGFVDSLIYYLTYLRQAGIARVPFEIEYVADNESFVVLVHCSMVNYVGEYLIDCFGKENPRDPLSYLLQSAYRYTEIFDLSFNQVATKLCMTGVWRNSEQQKNAVSTLLFFNHIQTAAQILNRLDKAIENVNIEIDQSKKAELSGDERFDALKSKKLPGNLIDMIVSPDEDSIFGRKPKVAGDVMGAAITHFEEMYPSRDVSSMSMDELKELLEHYEHKDLLEDFSETDYQEILDRIKKNNITSVYEEEIDRVRDEVKGDEDFQSGLSADLNNNIVDQIAQRMNVGTVNNALRSSNWSDDVTIVGSSPMGVGARAGGGSIWDFDKMTVSGQYTAADEFAQAVGGAGAGFTGRGFGAGGIPVPPGSSKGFGLGSGLPGFVDPVSDTFIPGAFENLNDESIHVPGFFPAGDSSKASPQSLGAGSRSSLAGALGKGYQQAIDSGMFAGGALDAGKLAKVLQDQLEPTLGNLEDLDDHAKTFLFENLARGAGPKLKELATSLGKSLNEITTDDIQQIIGGELEEYVDDFMGRFNNFAEGAYDNNQVQQLLSDPNYANEQMGEIPDVPPGFVVNPVTGQAVPQFATHPETGEKLPLFEIDPRTGAAIPLFDMDPTTGMPMEPLLPQQVMPQINPEDYQGQVLDGLLPEDLDLSKSFRANFQQNLQQGLESLGLKENELTSHDFAKPEIQTILKGAIRQSLNEELQVGDLSKDEIAEKKEQLIKILSPSLEVESPVMQEVFDGSLQEAKIQESNEISAKLFARSEDVQVISGEEEQDTSQEKMEVQKSGDMAPPGDDFEKTALISKLKQSQNEIKELKKQYEIATAQLKAKDDVIVSHEKATSEALVNPEEVQATLSQELKVSEDKIQEVQQAIQENRGLTKEQAAVVNQALQQEKKMREVAKQQETELKKAGIEMERKNNSFSRQIEIAQKESRMKDSIIQRAKDGLRQVSAAKDREIMKLKKQLETVKVGTLQPTELDPQTQRRMDQLQNDNQNMHKTLEMYKTKLQTAVMNAQQQMAKSMDMKVNHEVERLSKSKELVEGRLQKAMQDLNEIKAAHMKQNSSLIAAQNQQKGYEKTIAQLNEGVAKLQEELKKKPKTIEKIVEVVKEVPVEKIVEKIVEKEVLAKDGGPEKEKSAEDTKKEAKEEDKKEESKDNSVGKELTKAKEQVSELKKELLQESNKTKKLEAKLKEIEKEAAGDDKKGGTVSATKFKQVEETNKKLTKDLKEAKEQAGAQKKEVTQLTSQKTALENKVKALEKELTKLKKAG